jgi:hypothetical protein
LRHAIGNDTKLLGEEHRALPRVAARDKETRQRLERGYAMKISLPMLLMAALACSASDTTQAQVVREDGVKSVARILDGPLGAFFDDFTFHSNRPQILFATIDGDLYQTAGRPAHEEPHGTEQSGCSDEGGPGGFCLQVLEADGDIICWADRPVRPGWQRDPRLSCPLMPSRRSGETYTLRVSLRGEGENPCGPDGLYPDPAPDEPDHPYLLDVSLRDIVPEGAMKPAIALGTNRF